MVVINLLIKYLFSEDKQEEQLAALPVCPVDLFLPWPRSEGSAMTIRHPFGMLFLFLFLLMYQAVTRSENKLPHAQYNSDPQYFYRFWTPYKMTISGAD